MYSSPQAEVDSVDIVPYHLILSLWCFSLNASSPGLILYKPTSRRSGKRCFFFDDGLQATASSRTRPLYASLWCSDIENGCVTLAALCYCCRRRFSWCSLARSTSCGYGQPAVAANTCHYVVVSASRGNLFQ